MNHLPTVAAAPIKRLAVIGVGQVGKGIAYVSAVRARCSSVILVDKCPTRLAKGRHFVEAKLEKDLSDNKVSQNDAEVFMKAWRTVPSLEKLMEELAGSRLDMVIEAATEKLTEKREIFSFLARAFPDEHTILATNTNSISISKIAASAALHGEEAGKSSSTGRVIGLHWMHPVTVLPLVEIIPALQTTEQTIERARSFAQACGKTLVQSKDSPGFVANRLLMPYINEAIICLDEGVASRDHIDTTMHLAMSHPMGPLRLADFIGLDTCLAIMQTLHRHTGDSKYRPAALLGRMVAAGWIGKKRGRGFYDYPSENKADDELSTIGHRPSS